MGSRPVMGFSSSTTIGLATTALSGRFRERQVARVLEVAGSSLIERSSGEPKTRSPRYTKSDDGWLLEMIRKITGLRPACMSFFPEPADELDVQGFKTRKGGMWRRQYVAGIAV